MHNQLKMQRTYDFLPSSPNMGGWHRGISCFLARFVVDEVCEQRGDSNAVSLSCLDSSSEDKYARCGSRLYPLIVLGDRSRLGFVINACKCAIGFFGGTHSYHLFGTPGSRRRSRLKVNPLLTDPLLEGCVYPPITIFRCNDLVAAVTSKDCDDTILARCCICASLLFILSRSC